MRALLLAARWRSRAALPSPRPRTCSHQIEEIAGPRTGLPAAQRRETLQQMLARQPLDADTAVRIALLNNPGLEQSLAALAISDADRVAAAQLPNPHFAFARLREGQTLELERMLSFNVLQLLTLPWRAQDADRALQRARLQAAQQVIRAAADTRKALGPGGGGAADRDVPARCARGRRKPAPNWPAAWLAWATSAGCSRRASRRCWRTWPRNWHGPNRLHWRNARS
mgnify:CR=1 FL=1